MSKTSKQIDYVKIKEQREQIIAFLKDQGDDVWHERSFQDKKRQAIKALKFPITDARFKTALQHLRDRRNERTSILEDSAERRTVTQTTQGPTLIGRIKELEQRQMLLHDRLFLVEQQLIE